MGLKPRVSKEFRHLYAPIPCENNVIRTYTGVPIEYNYPEKFRIRPIDIKFRLCRMHRYSGDLPVSIVKHLYLCIQLADRLASIFGVDADALAQAVGLHDVHESVFIDYPTSYKKVLMVKQGDKLITLNDLEMQWEMLFAWALGVKVIVPLELVRLIDVFALAVEQATYNHQGRQASYEYACALRSKSSFVDASQYKACDEIMEECSKYLFVSDDVCWQTLTTVIPALAFTEETTAEYGWDSPYTG